MLLSNFSLISFMLKDQVTRKTLLHGISQGGLYPIPVKSSQVKLLVPPSFLHIVDSRLGHPSSVIVNKTFSSNNLPFVRDENKESVCDACLKAKSHQLPCLSSYSMSSAPLDLIYSNVWGSAQQFIGKHKYYVSFVDDYSRYTWIYLLKK